MAASAGSHAEDQTRSAGEQGLNPEAPADQQQQPFHAQPTQQGYGSEADQIHNQGQGVQQQDGDAEQLPTAQQPQEQLYRSLTGNSFVLQLQLVRCRFVVLIALAPPVSIDT